MPLASSFSSLRLVFFNLYAPLFFISWVHQISVEIKPSSSRNSSNRRNGQNSKIIEKQRLKMTSTSPSPNSSPTTQITISPISSQPPSNSSPPPATAASPPLLNSNFAPPPLSAPLLLTPSPSPSPPPPAKTPSPPPSTLSAPPPPDKSFLPGSTLAPPDASSSLPSTPTHKLHSKSTPNSNITATNSGGKRQREVITAGITIGILVLILLLLTIWCIRKRKRKESRLDTDSSYIINSNPSFQCPQLNSVQLAKPQLIASSRSSFTYSELAVATNGFSARNLLGEGGFGSVYKGYLPCGKEVAVKELKIGDGQDDRKFRAEVEIISRVHHRHLVSLVGYCIHQNQRFLVFNYVPNNTLHYHLHGEGRLVVLDWKTRVKIAAGAARGIAYLHEDCHPRIIHRDIKSSNILLDNNFDTLVADFGLAKLTLDTYTHVTTRVMGTFGYVAPEYASSGKLSEKSDVYSFGVLLLELITGRKPVDSTRPVGQESLVEWARPVLRKVLENEDFDELVDPKLNHEFDKMEMLRMIEAASACVRHLASKRPRMSQVVRALDSIFELSDLINGMRPGQSVIFEAKEHSAQIKMLERMAFGNQDYSSEFFNRSQNSWMRL